MIKALRRRTVSLIDIDNDIVYKKHSYSKDPMEEQKKLDLKWAIHRYDKHYVLIHVVINNDLCIIVF